MATNIYPEDLDSATATSTASLYDTIAAGVDYVFTGYNVTDGGSLVASIAAGEAVLAGSWIVSDATQTTTLADASTNKVYLDSDGTVDDTTGAIPGTAILLATVVTSGGSISSISHKQTIKNNRFVFIPKDGDESVNNSATLQDDDDFQFPILAGQLWEFALALDIAEPTSATPDFKFTTNQTAGALQYWLLDTDGVDASTMFQDHGDIATEYLPFLNDTTGGNPRLFIMGYFAAEADGTFIFKWAQGAAQASNTTIKDQSHMWAERMI